MGPHGSAKENQELKHAVIVGGGFAGLNCAKKLAKHPDLRVTLSDRNNYHQFQSLLYQVASDNLVWMEKASDSVHVRDYRPLASGWL